MTKNGPHDGAEERTRGLDPAGDEMRRLGYAAVDFLVDHLEGFSDRPVANLRPLDELRDRIEEPLPAGPRPLEDTLSHLDAHVLPYMTHVAHPRFHGYIPCPGSFYGALGVFLGAGLNAFVGSSLGGASMAALELETLEWVAEAVGAPELGAGIFTSGGSLANLGALAAALAERRCGRDAARVYVSDQGHGSMSKAARILGLPSGAIRVISSAEDRRLDTAQLVLAIAEDREAGHHPLFICANAGTTNSGAIDPLNEIAEICADENLWFHVDGAYGGFAAASSRLRPLFSGMERADSLTLDPHKWFYSPMGHGCLLVRRPEALHEAFAVQGTYLKDVDRSEVNFFDLGPEMSRPARALPVWLLIRTVGMERLAAEIERDVELSRLAAELLADGPEFEIVSHELSVVVFRLRSRSGESEAERAERELVLVQELTRGGDALVSGTDLEGRSALRLVVMNHRTTAVDVHRSVETLRSLAAAGHLGPQT